MPYMSLTFLDLLISEKKILQPKACNTRDTKVCVVYICVIHGYTDTFC